MKYTLIIAIALVFRVDASTNAARLKNAYFPNNYSEARASFKELASKLKGLPKNAVVSSGTYLVASNVDDDLTVDFLHLRCGNSKRLLLLTSGVHGPEAYVGSAAQIWYLKNEAAKRCNEGLSSLVIHAINPYGFKYHRRFTENNVDLNRNFSLSSAHFRAQNEAYEKLEKILNPKKKVKAPGLLSLKSTTRLLKKLISGISVDEIRQASVGGQFDFPQGIYFGGVQREPVVQWLERFLSPVLNSYQQVLHYDFHSGLGKKGELHMIVGPKMTKWAEAMLGKVILPFKDNAFEVTSPQDPGFYEISGDIIDFVSSLKHNKKIISLTAEFGTMGLGLLAQLKTLNRIINENQGFHFGYKNNSAKKIVEKRYLEVFFPDENSWAIEVEGKTKTLFRAVVDKFMRSSP